jgi:hypothetical protein
MPALNNFGCDLIPIPKRPRSSDAELIAQQWFFISDIAA